MTLGRDSEEVLLARKFLRVYDEETAEQHPELARAALWAAIDRLTRAMDSLAHPRDELPVHPDHHDDAT